MKISGSLIEIKYSNNNKHNNSSSQRLLSKNTHLGMYLKNLSRRKKELEKKKKKMQRIMKIFKKKMINTKMIKNDTSFLKFEFLISKKFHNKNTII